MAEQLGGGADIGSYVWRGGRAIALTRLDDRFTVMPSSPAALERLKTAPGVHEVQQVTPQVFKVLTTATERDTAMAAIRSEAFGTVAHHAYGVKNGDGTVYYLTDKIIVRFKPGTATTDIRRVLRDFALKVVKKYDGLDDTYLLQVTRSSGRGVEPDKDSSRAAVGSPTSAAAPKEGKNPIKLANLLRRHAADLIEYAEPNMVNRYRPAYAPDSEPLYPEQWHLHPIDGLADLDPTAHIDAEQAWDITRGDRGTVIAVLDDGFDLTHPEFQGNGKVVSPWDFVDRDRSPMPGQNNFHGTMVAGVAVAEINDQGIAGVAPGCAFMPVRFDYNADDDALVEVFAWVGQRADVLCCSWGPPPAYAPLHTALDETIARVARHGGRGRRAGKGCVICFAAGDFDAPIRDEVNADGFRWFDPDNRTQRIYNGPILNGKAAHPDVIAVAASTSLNRHAAYSGWGENVWVCAPSNNFNPLYPQEHAAGLAITTTDNEKFGTGDAPNSRYTSTFGGTSAAAAVVAGVAGLVLSANPELTAADVKEILKDTADEIVDPEPDVLLDLKLGVPDPETKWCAWFGYGKVNAAGAVQEALNRRGQAVRREIHARQGGMAQAGPLLSAEQVAPANPADLRKLLERDRAFARRLRIERDGALKTVRPNLDAEWQAAVDGIATIDPAHWPQDDDAILRRVRNVPFWWGVGNRDPGVCGPFGFETRFEVQVAPGREAAFNAWVERLVELARQDGRFQSGLLLRSLSQPTTYTGLSEWTAREDAQAFLNSAGYREFLIRNPLDQLVTSVARIEVYEFLAESVSPGVRRDEPAFVLISDWTLKLLQADTQKFVLQQYQRLQRLKEQSIHLADNRFFGGVVLCSAGSAYRCQVLSIFRSQEDAWAAFGTKAMQNWDRANPFDAFIDAPPTAEGYVLVRSWR